MCVCGAYGEVFCLHPPSRARHSLMSVREISCLKNNRPTGKEICKVTWRLRKSLLIRPIPAIRANLVVLATGVVLAIVGVPTKLSRLKMARAIHKFVTNLTLPSELRT